MKTSINQKADPKKEPNFVTAFDLSNQGADEDPIYHFVYGSQLYGTLFGIYGRFNTMVKGDQCEIDSVELKLLNYQGVVNIGFTPDDKPYYPPYYQRLGDKESTLHFGVKAFSGLYSKTVPIVPTVSINKDERFKFTFFRLSYCLDGFTSDPTIKDFGQPNGEVPNAPYFDTEFHARSGVDYFQNPLRPGMAGFGNLTLESLWTQPPFASPRCSQSIVNLFF